MREKIHPNALGNGASAFWHAALLQFTLDEMIGYPLGENRTRLGGVGPEIIVFNRRNEPAVRGVPKRQQVRLTMGLLQLTGLGIFQDRDGGVVDRSEVPHKTRPSSFHAHGGVFMMRSALAYDFQQILF